LFVEQIADLTDTCGTDLLLRNEAGWIRKPSTREVAPARPAREMHDEPGKLGGSTLFCQAPDKFIETLTR